MNSIEFWKYLLNNPTGKSLGVTMGGTGSATAKLFPDKIVVDVDSGQSTKAITITTPISFKVLDMHVIHQDANDCAVQLKNGSTAITDAVAVAASDKDIDRAAEIDDAQYAFSKDDDDLVITPTTDALVGTVVISIMPT